MTTIVYKDGILAGDTMICSGDMLFGYTKKIFDLGDKVVGLSGHLICYDQFIKFIKAEEYKKNVFTASDICFRAIVINRNTKRVSTYGTELVEEGDFKADFVAIGSGQLVAQGALLMGATARQAVECAAKIDRFTGGEIDEIKI